VLLKGKSDITSAAVPWWTTLAAFAIIHLGTEISLLFKYDTGVADYYLPTSLSVLLINWWGPARILPVMYINAVLSTYLWGIPLDRWTHWLAYGIPETVFTFLSWYLFRKLFNGKYWLPDTQSTVLFLIAGILIPILPEILMLQSLLVWFGDQPFETFWEYGMRNWLGEFTSTFGLALPVLYYVTPYMKKAGLLYEPNPKIPQHEELSPGQVAGLVSIFIVIVAMVFIIEFQKFWYIYGLVSLFVAIRFGFGPATVTNYVILFVTYILPTFLNALGMRISADYSNVTDILLGASLLFVFAAITGRVISDVKIAEAKLQKQNQELDQTNKELDRFVYSVSHDLSAPLKSILGLVNISRITSEPREHVGYLNRIESSVIKLEAFIAEILDYSRNKRQDIVLEQIKLKELCNEILENLKYTEDFSHISVDLSQLEQHDIVQDKTRLRIILNNLISNAVKFQKRYDGHSSFIRISSRKIADAILIEVEDNGEGIKPELQEKIFDMFYRGNENSNGSGLGLYIAKEAAMRMRGDIFVRSEYGKGSVFTVALKSLNQN
jgi:two-component system, sensor histidine kinase